MRICQFTDIHIDHSKEGRIALDRLQTFVSEIAQQDFDLIVNTGDICNDQPERAIYETYLLTISSLSIPIYHIPGNHDDLHMMQEVFGTSPFPGEPLEMEGFELLFLNTNDARVSEEQSRMWLDRLNAGRLPQLIFMHHPPAYCGCPHMDDHHAFQQIENWYPLLRQALKPVYVFCGHYHTERVLRAGQLQIHITPSTYKNIAPFTREYQRENDFGIGYRVITLEGGTFRQKMHYLPVSDQ